MIIWNMLLLVDPFFETKLRGGLLFFLLWPYQVLSVFCLLGPSPLLFMQRVRIFWRIKNNAFYGTALCCRVCFEIALKENYWNIRCIVLLLCSRGRIYMVHSVPYDLILTMWCDMVEIFLNLDLFTFEFFFSSSDDLYLWNSMVVQKADLDRLLDSLP